MTKFAQVFLLSLFVCVLSLNVVAQKKKTVPTTKAITTVKKTVSKTGVIEVQAGIVYQSDGVQPVARGSFLVLDESLEKILQDAELTKNERDENLVDAYAHSIRFPDLYGDFIVKAKPVIDSHTKQSFTTDFDGKATLTPLPVGTYYLVGYYRTRGGYAVWNFKVDVVAGQNKVLLDQANAVVSF